MKAIARIIAEGENEILLLPPGVGFGIDVEIITERRGNKLILSPLPHDGGAADVLPDRTGM